MARLARLTVAEHPHHIVQRGNNGQTIFADAADRDRMLQILADQAIRCRVAVHAYVLMDSYFHLLATPATVQALPTMMQAVGRSYVRYFNDRYQRSGTLWEGRYRSTVVQEEHYLLRSMVFLDLDPVRAGQAAEPQAYVWSSHRHYTGQRVDRLVVPPKVYWALGNTPFARDAAYAALAHQGLMSAEEAAIAQALNGWALGDAAFVAELQKQTTRRLSASVPGRPTKTSKYKENKPLAQD